MIGELPDSKGYNTVLMVVDHLSKQIHAIPTVTSLDSARVTQLFLEHIWCHHRLSEEVISDCRSAFVSNFSHEVAADRKSTRLNSSHQIISYAVFCLKKKKKHTNRTPKNNSYSDVALAEP